MEVLGEGSFSKVFKAQSLKTGNYVAIKCMKSLFNSIQEVILSSYSKISYFQVNHLREIQALRKLSPHEHIIKLLEIL